MLFDTDNARFLQQQHEQRVADWQLERRALKAHRQGTGESWSVSLLRWLENLWATRKPVPATPPTVKQTAA